ncbi:MAG: PDZ domain-containing protein [Acidobacteria bacterium]|nr:PDZ domain-containing protein [Acidobacteriota bacterium]
MNHRTVGALLLTASALLAQLTPEQKAIDLQTVASLYAKQYAPYEWKRENVGFDLFNLRPWLDRARQTKTDLEYLDLLEEYTASLKDIHSYYVANSDFVADLHMYTDVYDGKVLIEQITRSYLPAARYDFAVGDEIVLFDGKPVMDLVKDIARISSFANERSTMRWAADQLVYRQQAYLPRVVELGESATILVRRADGSEKSYVIPWDKSGTPLMNLGPLPNFRTARPGVRDESPRVQPEFEPADEELPVDPGVPAFRKPWVALQRHVSARPVNALRGFALRDPIYRMPVGFVQRLGRNRADYFFSGTYTTNGKRIGLIRIGTFQPVSFSLLSLPINQFQQEIGFMKANTDVLIVDVTRNEGGYACYSDELLQRLIPRTFTTIGVEIRPNLDIIRDFEATLQDLQDYGEEWEYKVFSTLVKDVKTAYSENRGRTGPIPLCSVGLDIAPAKDRTGAVLAYDKPVLVLTDEFSTSAADSFSAVIQDAKIGKLFGFRTAGAGGNTVNVQAGFYSEGSAAVTQMLTVRPTAQAHPGFPATRYIENVGVEPDIPYDFQTRENLVNSGTPFVDAFTKAALALIP